MLDSLEIQNYRNFKHLRIEKLGRVNLIIGKNNTGKTSLLEAVSLYVANDKIWALRENMRLRDEFDKEFYSSLSNFEYDRENLIMLKSIFWNRKIDRDCNVIISTNENTPFSIEINYKNQISESISITHKEFSYRTVKLSNPFFTDRNIFSGIAEPFKYVTATCINYNNNIDEWGKIVLTENEKYVIDALNIIDKSIQRFSYVSENNVQKPKVSLKTGEVINLRSMGDGINRILAIILAMVNCKNGYLLIDEFDNGLHVSVQKQLWEIVFELANKLNIQVFATTHSYDCIDAFADVLGSGKYPETDGIMLRLDNWQNNIEATIYEAKDIFNTTRLQIDPR